VGAPRATHDDDGDALVVVNQAIDLLDTGEARVAEIDPVTDEVIVHEWLRQAILLLFILSGVRTIEHGPFEYTDKLALKHGLQAAGVRAVPGASARRGAFLGRGVVLMPSYVNIGARVGPTRWLTRGPRSGRARRSASGCTSLAASA